MSKSETNSNFIFSNFLNVYLLKHFRFGHLRLFRIDPFGKLRPDFVLRISP